MYIYVFFLKFAQCLRISEKKSEKFPTVFRFRRIVPLLYSFSFPRKKIQIRFRIREFPDSSDRNYPNPKNGPDGRKLSEPLSSLPTGVYGTIQHIYICYMLDEQLFFSFIPKQRWGQDSDMGGA